MFHSFFPSPLVKSACFALDPTGTNRIVRFGGKTVPAEGQGRKGQLPRALRYRDLKLITNNLISMHICMYFILLKRL